MERDHPEYVAERFDIHVMAFADDSAATVEALAQIFSIEQGVAQRLVCDAPVVVKRAASPEIADRLLDALARLGAQVVILPTSGARALEPVMKEPEPEPAANAGWGGFDFGDGAPAAPPTPAASALGGGGFGMSEPAAEPQRAAPPSAMLDDDLFGGLASGAHAPSAIAPISLPPLIAASPPHAEPDEAEASALPALELDMPVAQPVESSVPPALRASELELPVFAPPPAPAVPRRAGPPAPPAASVAARPAIPGRRAGAAMPPPPPQPPPFVVPPPPPAQALGPRASDLGLGAVPPLPSLSGAPPLLPDLDSRARISSGPPLRPNASALPQMDERPRFENRMHEAAEPMRLPRIDATTAAAARQPPAAEPPQQPQASAPKTKQKTAAGGKPDKREPSARFAIEGEARADASKPIEKKAEHKSEPVALPSRGRALVELFGSLLVLFLGLHFDNTVLHGNASTVSIVLHGFAFYGIGSGIRGLWP